MSRSLKSYFFFHTFSMDDKFSTAEERFCLDQTGFMYPLFTEKNCNEDKEELITKNEFINILDVKDELRKEALDNYRSKKIT